MSEKDMIIPKELVFQVKKPRFNPFQCGNGPKKSKKVYSRKQKHKKELM